MVIQRVSSFNKLLPDIFSGDGHVVAHLPRGFSCWYYPDTFDSILNLDDLATATAYWMLIT
jgi:hypothetical protein